jgi:hypothetical protein
MQVVDPFREKIEQLEQLAPNLRVPPELRQTVG